MRMMKSITMTRMTRAKKADPAVTAARQQIVPSPPVKVFYGGIIQALLKWFPRLYPPTGAADFVLDAAETALLAVPPSLIEKVPRTARDEAEEEDDLDDDDDDSVEEWRVNTPFVGWLNLAEGSPKLPGWTPEHDVRLFRLCRWLDEPTQDAVELTPSGRAVVRLHCRAATLADFSDHLIGPRAKQSYSHESFETLGHLTRGENKNYPIVDQRPELREVVPPSSIASSRWSLPVVRRRRPRRSRRRKSTRSPGSTHSSP